MLLHKKYEYPLDTNSNQIVFLLIMIIVKGERNVLLTSTQYNRMRTFIHISTYFIKIVSINIFKDIFLGDILFIYFLIMNNRIKLMRTL